MTNEANERNDRRRRVREVFMQAADAPESDRAAMLDRLCGDDKALRREVEDLLRADRDAAKGGFMTEPTGALAATTAAALITERPGTKIGPYKLLQRIGEGGFGVVFMAEQDEPVRRRVALKVIKLGMDTRQVVARFEQERQALALMDHPHIARVLDAGATPSTEGGGEGGEGGTGGEGGRPYFVMEYVTGDPITAFADAHKLSVRDRLELFSQVCAAVQHAHMKGVIHRDLKPRNVLVSMVDGRPHAKVIDFGIAKATGARLTDKTLFTEHRQLIGTPEYMSPEQAEGSPDIDTRTDVYSLGVLLYELLTGATPFDGERLRSAAWGEMQRIIREEEPPMPSVRLSRAALGGSVPGGPALRDGSSPLGAPTLRGGSSSPDGPGAPPVASGEVGVPPANPSSLASIAAARGAEPARLGTLVKGELDWIVMKALDKDRARRYESPNQLAADVRRHLAGEAVVAAPPSAAYRLRKFVRRNKGRVAAAGVVAAVLVLGAATTSVGFALESRQRRIAETARLAEREQREAAEQATEAAEAARLTEASAKQEAEAQRVKAEQNIYVANIFAAASDLYSARERLDACPERLRGWEWRHLNAKSDAHLFLDNDYKWPIVFSPPDDGVYRSPDNAYFAKHQDNGIHVYNTLSGQLLHVLKTKHEPEGIRFSSAGRKLYYPPYRGIGRTWDLLTGELVLEIGDAAQGGVHSGDISPDGTRVVANEGPFISVWDIASGVRTNKMLLGEPYSSVQFRSEGSHIVSHRSGNTLIWDANTPSNPLVFDDEHSRSVLSPDGNTLLLSSADGTLRLRDCATSDTLLELQHPYHERHRFHRFRDMGTANGSGHFLAHHPLGIRGWSLSKDGRYTADMDTVMNAGFVGDGDRIVSVLGPLVRVWDASTGKVVLDIGLPSAEENPDHRVSAAFDAKGLRAVLTFGNGAVWAIDLSDGTRLLELTGTGPAAVAINSDGSHIAASWNDGTVRIYEITSAREARAFSASANRVAYMCYDPTGTNLFICDSDGDMVLWNADANEPVVLLRSTAPVDDKYEAGWINTSDFGGFDWSGQRMALLLNDKTVEIRNAATGEPILRLHAPYMSRAAFSPDGSRIATFGDAVRIWDAASGTELAVFRVPDRGEEYATGLAFSPDGTRLFATTWRGATHVFDTVPWRERRAARAPERAGDRPPR